MASLEGKPGSDTDKPPPVKTGSLPLAAKEKATAATVPDSSPQPDYPWTAEQMSAFDPENQPKTEAWKHKKELERLANTPKQASFMPTAQE